MNRTDAGDSTNRSETGVPEMPCHEHYRGYGIMALPFDSGHVLALRVMPENDFAPFQAVWHRTPAGAWSMYVDGPHHEVFCPRLFGPALAESRQASIDVEWSGGPRLRVRMEEPALDWSVRQLADRALGLGPLDLEGTVPGGQRVLVRPRRIHLVGDARAVLGGEDLGSPVRASENPATGSFRWPARGVLAEGEVYVKIDDLAEHRRRRVLFRPEGDVSAAS